MRSHLYYDLRHLLFLFPLFLFFFQGCARSVLPTYPASQLQVATAMEAFARYQEVSTEACSSRLDAEVDAVFSVSGWFSHHRGNFSGYLQAMAPGYFKFIAINPLGQPFFIFVTNGSMFKSLNVLEEKAYIGSVHSQTYRKFAPPGFEPESFYYWLTGRVQPGDIQIKAVMTDRDQNKFWLQINHADASTDSLLLFDPEELVILRRVLRDGRGRHLVDIRYAEHRTLPTKMSTSAPKGQCRVPTAITVSSNGDAGRIELRLRSFLEDARFSAEDFRIETPTNFEQLLVK